MAAHCRIAIAFNFFLTRPVGADSFHADGRTHTSRQTWRS